jgi:hypothetical protein
MIYNMPITVAARNYEVCDRSLAEITGLNPAEVMAVCLECCVLPGKGLYVGLITRPKEFYRPWCVLVGDQETSIMIRPWPAFGCYAKAEERDEEKFTTY